MNWIWMIVRFVVLYFLQLEGNKMVQRTKAKGALLYLKTLNTVRRTFIGVLVALFVFQFVVFSFFAMIGFSIWLMPWELETKIWTAFGLSCVGFVVPFLICSYIFREATWYKISQAEKIIDSVDEAA